MQSQNRKIAVVSLSGGMDSTCLLIHLLAKEYEVHGVSFDYGQKHKIELQRLEQNLEYLKTKGFELKSYNVLDISQIGKLFESSLIQNDLDVPQGHYEEENMKSTVVPNRNMMFASIIQGYALSIALREKNKVVVALGVHSGDHAIYPDCTLEFYNAQEEAFKKGNWDSELVNYYLPYMSSNKTGILKDCLNNSKWLDLDFYTILKNTNTSYNPDDQGRSSGTSGSDIERIEAFITLGLEDPVPYSKGWDWTRKNALKILNNQNEKNN